MALKTPPPTEDYRKGWDAIFGKKRKPEVDEPSPMWFEATPEEEEAFKEIEQRNARSGT